MYVAPPTRDGRFSFTGPGLGTSNRPTTGPRVFLPRPPIAPGADLADSCSLEPLRGPERPRVLGSPIRTRPLVGSRYRWGQASCRGTSGQARLVPAPAGAAAAGTGCSSGSTGSSTRWKTSQALKHNVRNCVASCLSAIAWPRASGVNNLNLVYTALNAETRIVTVDSHIASPALTTSPPLGASPAFGPSRPLSTRGQRRSVHLPHRPAYPWAVGRSHRASLPKFPTLLTCDAALVQCPPPCTKRYYSCYRALGSRLPVERRALCLCAPFSHTAAAKLPSKQSCPHS